VKAQNAGLFISRGKGIHPTRVIDSHELIFVKQGELEMWEEERAFSLKAGQALHLWPQRQHGGLKPMSPKLKFYWVHFDVIDDRDGQGSQEKITRVPQVGNVQRPEKLESLFRYFLDEQESGNLDSYSASLLVLLMLAEVSRTCEDTDDSDSTNVIATRAHTYIRMHYDLPISSSKIAEALGYNPDYLGRLYRETYGCTLTEAIHHRRIRVACRHLLDGDMTIRQIAQACGFSDPDYFRRIFRRYMRTSPSIYREQFARVHVNTQ
jgi:AraC-like DNA-binding protein